MKKVINVSIPDSHITSIASHGDSVGFWTDAGDTILLDKRTLERGLAVLASNKPVEQTAEEPPPCMFCGGVEAHKKNCRMSR